MHEKVTLDTIIKAKRVEVEKLHSEKGMEQISARAQNAEPVRSFEQALRNSFQQDGQAIIAELKKASPSKGVIRKDFDPAEIAKACADNGASCLSVLTDSKWFQGEHKYIAEARAVVDLPILRKDFIIDPIQVAESRALGADCILLIMAAVDDTEAQKIESCAMKFGMDVLIEVHNLSELNRAHNLSSRLIGVNNRDLNTMRTFLGVGEKLLPKIPTDCFAVSLSGISNPADFNRMKKAKAKGYLIGEALMVEPNISDAFMNLYNPGSITLG